MEDLLKKIGKMTTEKNDNAIEYEANFKFHFIKALIRSFAHYLEKVLSHKGASGIPSIRINYHDIQDGTITIQHITTGKPDEEIQLTKYKGFNNKDMYLSNVVSGEEKKFKGFKNLLDYIDYIGYGVYLGKSVLQFTPKHGLQNYQYDKITFIKI